MYVLRILQLVPAQPTQDQEELPAESVLGFRNQIGGTQHWLVSRLVPPWPVTDDEVLPNGTNFGLEDEFNASILLSRIAQGLSPASVALGDDEGLFFVSVDDEGLPLQDFFRMWAFTYPTFPFLDDDPWSPPLVFGLDEDLVILWPAIPYATGRATLDEEVLPNAVNLELDEDYWSPVFTMTIANAMQSVTTTDDDVWVVFVAPPAPVAKGLPTLGAGA